MKINTYLKDEPDALGNHLIFIYVSHGGKRAKISTGIKIPKASWTGKDIKACKQLPEKKAALNSKLLKVKISLIEKIKAEFDLSFQEFTLDQLKEKFSNYGKDPEQEQEQEQIQEDETIFTVLVEKYKEKYKNLRKPKTLGRLKQVTDRLEEFSPGLRITDIDYNYLIGYCDFLIQKGMENNTIKHNHIKAIKIIAKEAERNGIKVSSDIFQFSFKSSSKKPFAATWEEVQAIAAMEDDKLTKAQRHIRDVFVISCYTGLRDSDMRNIQKSNISDYKGKKVLRVIMEKTDFDYHIPLSGKVVEILQKHDYSMPVYTQQHHNREIKNIAELALKEAFYSKVKIQGNKKTITKTARKDMFSTHTGRRTFGRRFLDKGGNIVILSKILGHSSIETTLKYIGYEQHEVINEFFRIMGDD